MENRKLKIKDRRRSVRDVLQDHTKEDNEHFKNIGLALGRIEKHMENSTTFMQDLSWLSDISKGAQLLKKPSLWFIGFIVAVVILVTNVKTLLVWAVSWVMPK